MTAGRELFYTALARGIRLSTDSGRLNYECPQGAMSDEIHSNIKQFKQEIIFFLEQSGEDVRNIHPLSFNQQSLWFENILNPSSSSYNVSVAFEWKDAPCASQIENALNALLAQHPILTAQFNIPEGASVPFQQFRLDKKITLKIKETANRQVNETGLLQEEYQKPFYLDRELPIRVTLFSSDTKSKLLLFVIHHIVCDAYSIKLLLDDFFGYFSQKISSQPKLKGEVGYLDHIDNQLSFSFDTDEKRTPQLHSFVKLFSSYPSSVNWVVNWVGRPQIPDNSSATHIVIIDSKRYDLAKIKGKNLGAGLNAIFLAIFEVWLLQMTQDSKNLYGMPFLGRSSSQFRDSVGYFVNPVVLGTSPTVNKSFDDLVADCQGKIRAGILSQEYPFSLLVEDANVSRSEGKNPIFQILYNFLDKQILSEYIELFIPDNKEVNIRDFRLTPAYVAQQEGQVDLTFECYDTGESITVFLKYSHLIWNKEKIEHHGNRLRNIFDILMADPNSMLNDVLNKDKDFNTNNIVISSTYTVDPIAPYLNFLLSKLGYVSQINFSSYNHVFQELLDKHSLTCCNTNGVNVFIIRLEDWSGTNLTGEFAEVAIRQNAQDFVSGVKAAVKSCPSASFFVLFCPLSPKFNIDSRIKDFCLTIESEICYSLKSIPNTFSISSAELMDAYPVDDYYQPLGESVGHIPYTESFFAALATIVCRRIFFINSAPFKAIAVDCDNTLWHGVVGEDGPEGVVVSPPFQEIQRLLLEQKSKGVLICLCSKNAEHDVKNVFLDHPDMLLKWEDISFSHINWEPKSINIQSLASKIGIGLDSFIFIDDNPVECAEVSSSCPAVFTINLPADTSLWTQFLKNIWVFDRPKTTREDSKRVEMYQNAIQRDSLLGKSSSFKDFINGLDLQIVTQKLTPENVSRVSQITQRTNQFNFTAQRKTENEIQAIINSDSQFCLTTHVSDRFGDYGLVGVILFTIVGNKINVDNFLLSCRSLSKGVEHAMVNELGSFAENAGIEKIEFVSFATDRNQPARRFLESFDTVFIKENNDKIIRVLVTCNDAKSLKFNPDKFNNGVEHKKQTKVPVANFSRSPITEKYQEQLEHFSLVLFSPDELVKNVKKATFSFSKPLTTDNTQAETATEKKIASVWQDVLNTDQVCVHSNFFDIGGKSILIPPIVINLQKRYSIEISIVDMFRFPTIASLSAHIDTGNVTGDFVTVQNSAQRQRAALSSSKHENPFARLRNRNKTEKL